MDSALNTAARALAAGDPLAALDQVALRDDAFALALRGTAMAQLGELAEADALLRRAVQGFGGQEPLARARCIVARTEVAVARRELGTSPDGLGEAIAVLEDRGDRSNAIHGRLLELRWLLLLGRVDEAESKRAALVLRDAPPVLEAIGHLVAADIAVRRVRAGAAAQALEAATKAAARLGIGALSAEIAVALDQLRRPAARMRVRGVERVVGLAEVEALLASSAVVVDACRRAVGPMSSVRSLARRPVLLSLVVALAEAWPGDVDREHLLARVFEAGVGNESWRVRLRVEVGRLRKVVEGFATVEATARGYVLRAAAEAEVVVLLPPVDGNNAAVLAVLADGAPWSTSALAMALGVSQRSVQRALATLEAEGRVQPFGRARARRWVAPTASGFTTALLLPRVEPGR
ncbi:MAG: helix-turn-helix domain-containing protein [Deltaproteobacteria bacterium]|nr:helix-turn-helix domain-containing protein [Deltaproteobacteria bacterium]